MGVRLRENWLIEFDHPSKQVPWSASSLTGDFYFLAGDSDLPAQQTAPAQPKTGSLIVWTEPEGASVHVEGRHKGQAPVKVSGLKPDTYRVEARQEGFVAASRQVRVRAGATATSAIMPAWSWSPAATK